MIPLMTKLKVMKDKALKLLDEIEANVSTCCAITMEPDEVLVMIEQLRDEINKLGNQVADNWDSFKSGTKSRLDKIEKELKEEF